MSFIFYKPLLSFLYNPPNLLFYGERNASYAPLDSFFVDWSGGVTAGYLAGRKIRWKANLKTPWSRHTFVIREKRVRSPVWLTSSKKCTSSAITQAYRDSSRRRDERLIIRVDRKLREESGCLQLTIPKFMASSMGIAPGQKVTISVSEDGIRITKKEGI